MNNNNIPTQDVQSNNNSQPSFQWEVPMLYSEDWLATLGGSNAFTTEDAIFHT